MLPGNAAVQLSPYAESCNSNASTRTECQLWYRASTTALERPGRPIATQRLPEGETYLQLLGFSNSQKGSTAFQQESCSRVSNFGIGFLMFGRWLFGRGLVGSGLC